MRYAGNLKEILRLEALEREKSNRNVNFEPKEDDKDDFEEEEDEVAQTFPKNSSMVIHRQDDGELTCGMKCLQNMYGPHIVTREEMDSTSKNIEKISHGIQMYNPELGFYASEVLETVLQVKGKCVQRISLDKITSEYFVPIIQLNTTFSGYIVALGGAGILKHYICIRYNGQYKKIDSIRGVKPIIIPKEQLFVRHSNGEIRCCFEEQRPVVAVLAVGSSPFVEYTILHECWTDNLPTAEQFQSIIVDSLNYRKHRASYINKKWFQKWERRRLKLDETSMTMIRAYIEEQLQTEKNVIVRYDDRQTVIRCKTVNQLVKELRAMQWIHGKTPFVFKQNGCQVYHSDMPISKLLDWSLPIQLSIDDHPQIGGFYTFNCSLSGTCTDKKEHSYSVRDGDGNIHIVYKKTIENIKQ
jgi:hypothetical protein